MQSLCLIVFSCILINIPHFLVFQPVAYGQKNLTNDMFQLAGNIYQMFRKNIKRLAVRR